MSTPRSGAIATQKKATASPMLDDDEETPPRPKVANPPATRKGRRSAQAFRTAAAKVFGEKGFLNATVADIAAEAGRSPAAFYYHYDSKEHVLVELFRDFAAAVQEGARETLEPSASAREQIDRLVRNFYQTYVEWLPVMTGVFQLSMIDPEFHERWRSIRLVAVRSIRHWVTEAQAQGYAKGLDPDLAASALGAMLDGFCYIWLARDGDLPKIRLDPERAQQTLVELCYVSLYGTTENGVKTGAVTATKRAGGGAVKPANPAKKQAARPKRS